MVKGGYCNRREVRTVLFSRREGKEERRKAKNVEPSKGSVYETGGEAPRTRPLDEKAANIKGLKDKYCKKNKKTPRNRDFYWL